MLPGAMLRNAGLRFVCKDVHLRVETKRTPFTLTLTKGEVLRMPVAQHGEEVLSAEELRILLGYAYRQGELSLERSLLLENALDFSNLTARSVMVPLSSVVSLDVARFDCGAPGAEAPHDCKADATAMLRRSDFGMDAYTPLIGDDIMLAFEVVAHR